MEQILVLDLRGYTQESVFTLINRASLLTDRLRAAGHSTNMSIGGEDITIRTAASPETMLQFAMTV